MQLVTFLSAASAMVASASASQKVWNAVANNKDCDLNKPHARIINRCDYPVHLWSVFKGEGCPDTQMVTLKKGEVYSENFPEEDPANPTNVGISIKISKTEQCKGGDITQLEYYLERLNKAFAYNYLDVSYVDCLGGDCPTKKEGYYLKSGSQSGAYAASAGNTWCPILACHDAASCAKMSYILPDDVQTKTCDLKQNMDFYMCGGDAPSQEYPAAPVVSKPSPTSVKDTYSEGKFKADAAAVTAAPEVKEPAKQAKTKTHVEVVYVTAYEYVNAKRHAHGHARRHQQFHA